MRETTPTPLDAPAAQGADILFLSDSAHRALTCAPPDAAGFDGLFTFEGGVEARVAVAPGTSPGTVRLAVNLEGGAGAASPPVRLDAVVRTSWLEGTVQGATGTSQRAARLVCALMEVAAVPGQRTVAITTAGGQAPGSHGPLTFEARLEQTASRVRGPLHGDAHRAGDAPCPGEGAALRMKPARPASRSSAA